MNMEEYNELENIITEIEKGLHDDKELLTESIKEYFKSLMMEAGDVAIMLEKISSNSPQAIDEKPVLDFATDTVLRIHKISPNALSELCSYSGLSDKQILKISETCLAKENSEDKAVCFLFESTALELSLINYPKNKELLNQTKQSNYNSNDTTQDENTFDAFVRYLVSNGVPSVVLEELARLSIYQKLQFPDDLKVNFKLQKIYNTFVETGKITKDEIDYSKTEIVKSILKNIQDYPIQILSANGGMPIAKFGNSYELNESFLRKRAPATYFDAWGVKDGILHVLCVTNNYTFETQDNQVIRDANGIENGIKKGELKGITGYKIIGLCNPLIGDDNDDYLAFSEQLKAMQNSNTISKNEFMSLKFSAVHKEMLKILENTSDALYDKIVGKVSLGFHSDNSPSIAIKSKEVQVSTSVAGISRAISVLKKITETNPSLHKIDTAFSIYANDLVGAYRLACATLINNPPSDNKLFEMLEQAEDDLIKINEVLIKTNSRHAQGFTIGIESSRVVKSRKNTYNQTYADQQDALLNNRISFQENLKLQTATHSVNLHEYPELSRRSLVSLVLTDKYNGPVTQSLLNDCLVYQIKDLEIRQDNSKTGNMHLGTYKQILKGFNQGFNKGFDVTLAIEAIEEYPDIKERILKNREGEDVGKIQSILKQQPKLKP